MRSVNVKEFGGPEVLRIVETVRPTPTPQEVVVEVKVSGINYLDVYQRRGTTPLQPPFPAGVEGVGIVAELGKDVSDFTVGQRVGWLSGGQGSFADFTAVAASKAVPIPDGIDDESAAAVLMQGVTAHYLATDTYPIQRGDTVLVHAAAGGVGHMLTQIAKLYGATVIGTVSTSQKAPAARAAGADHVISYANFADEVRNLTDGRGVAAVYDGVGAATFDESLSSLQKRGILAVYGATSGPTPPLDIPRLNSGGSLYVTRPTVVDYTATREELRTRALALFEWVAHGDLTVNIGERYPISDVAAAFEALESRRTQGKLLLIH